MIPVVALETPRPLEIAQSPMPLRTLSASPTASDDVEVDIDDAETPSMVSHERAQRALQDEMSSGDDDTQEGDGSADAGSEEGVPVALAQVMESTDDSPKTSEQDDEDEVLAKIRDTCQCESVEVLPTGEIMALPKGWTTRQSKTYGGHTYFVSPYGQTQWIRPSVKTGIGYKWNHEIEVTFGPGRLGLNLKQIAAEPGTQFTDLPVYIAEMYKLPGGPSPAEIYNWSVKPEKRLYVGMRMTAMNGIPLTGFPHAEVRDKVNHMPRPVRIKFADVSKGIVGRVEEEKPQEETVEQKEARAALAKQKNLRMEFFQVSVAREIRSHVWAISRNRMHKKEQELSKKTEILTRHLDAQNEMHALLEKEHESLVQETATLRELVRMLGLQEEGKIESPEVVKSTELQKRNAELDDEIKTIMAENEILLQERTRTEEALDAIQKELDAYGGDDDLQGVDDFDVFSNAFLGALVERGSINSLDAQAHEQLLEKIRYQQRQLREETGKQEERIRVAEYDIEQFKLQMTHADASFQREYEFISGDRPPQIAMLEEKVASLRKTLHETVSGVMLAASVGDRAKLNHMTIERGRLTGELQKAIVEIENLETDQSSRMSTASFRDSYAMPTGQIMDGGRESWILDAPSPTSLSRRDSDVARLRGRLNSLQRDLLETVNELSQIGNTNDSKRLQELTDRRVRLKEDIEAVHKQFQAVVGQPSSRPLRLAGSPADKASTTGRNETTNSAADAQGQSRGSANPPNGVGRAAAGATEKEAMPTIAGPLMKHPGHTNEGGLFRNMSLRGVRERYCVLDGSGLLKYYKRKTDREPRGVIPLDSPSLEVVYSKTEKKNSEFSLCTSTHQNRFVAKNHNEMMRWVTALEKTHELIMQRRAAAAANGNGITTTPPELTRLSSADSQDSSARSRPRVSEDSVASSTDGGRSRASESQGRGGATMRHRATLGF